MKLPHASAFLVSLLALAACAAPAPSPPMACPHIPPSPAQAGAPIKPPVSGFRQILRPGYWDWQDGDYTWTPPQWLTLFVPGQPLWQAGFWTPNAGVCVWSKAHFIMPPAPRA